MIKTQKKSEINQVNEILTKTFRTSLIVGLLLGALFGLEIAGMGDLLPYPKDAFVFILVVSLTCVIICFLFFSVLLLFLRTIFHRRGDSEQKNLRIIQVAGIFLVIYSQALLGFFEINRPVSFSSPKIILGIFIIIMLTALLSYGLQIIFSRFKSTENVRKKKSLMKRLLLWLPCYILTLTIIVILVSFFITRTHIRKEPLDKIEARGKVLLLGIDAAYWDTLLTLNEAKKLPNFEKLIKEGASGKLPSLITMWGATANTITYGIHSPAIWTSIFTGKSPFKHGIKDFLYTEIPGINHPFRYPLIPSFIPYKKNVENIIGLKVRPYNRFFRKTKAAWNILSDAGLKVGALGWWDTWPIEEVNGYLLSDRLTDPNLNNRWFPDNLIKNEDVNFLLTQIENPSLQDLQYFTQFPYDHKFKEHFEINSREYMRNDLMFNLVKNFYIDKFRGELGLNLLNQGDLTLLAVYFFGIDPVGHAFSRFKNPELFTDVEPEEIEYFGEIIDKYYIWMDNEIGKYLQKVDRNTTVVICSDHGMGSWLKVSSVKKGVRLSGSHRKNGVIILWGNHIRKGVKISPKSVLDVFPTILYLIGMPVARDMDGAIIKDAIDPGYWAEFPNKTIKTYEDKRYMYRFDEEISSKQFVDKKVMEKLKSLGYLK
ncbi:MAG: alkaline phosphatase family protein [Candidatus Hodarchaeota archaeon]